MRLCGRGHPGIRATHAKTLEFTADAEIGPGATCVVAVGSRPLSDPRPFAGPVRLELIAGGHSVVVHAIGNPLWVPGGPAIVRRSDVRLPDTIATDADLAAADLPRDLVAALTDPATTVSLTISAALAARAGLVLLWAPASHDRLTVEAAAVTLVVSEDGGTDRLLAARDIRTGRADAVGAVLDGGGRVLVVSTDDVPGWSVVEHLGRADTMVEVTGLPGSLAVAAAAASRAPVVTVPGRGDAGRALRSAPADHRLVIRTPAATLDKLARAVEQHRGGAGIVVARAPYERPVRLGPTVNLGGSDLWCCIEPGEGSAGLGPVEVRLVEALLADGVPTRTAARAVAELAGMARRDAYAAVLDLAGRRSRPAGPGS